MLAFFVLLCLSFLCFGYQLHIVLQRRKLARRSLDDLLAQVTAVNRERMTEIAQIYLHPASQQLRVEPWQMWEAVGGLAGLNHLYSNANALLDLAHFAEQWNDESGRVLSEMMRRDAVRVKRAIFRLQLAYVLRLRLAYAPFHLQEVIASYCMLRERLLGAYRDAHVGLLPRIAHAV